MLTLAILQQEVKEWSSRNFPNNKPHHPLLGIIEEIFGELNEAEHIEEKHDALADTMIYVADYCWRNDIDLSAIEPQRSYTFIDTCLGKFCHYHLKGEQGIRHTPEKIKEEKVKCVANIIKYLILCWHDSDTICVTDFLDEVVAPVWDKVKQRDWVNKPMTAATEVA